MAHPFGMAHERSGYRDDREALEEAERRIERELAEVRARLAAKRPFEVVRLRPARPCNQPWDAMQGDDRKRFCASCSQFVWNVAEMTEDEVIDLMGSEAACLRLLRREDGTVITRECRRSAAPRVVVALALGAAATTTAMLAYPGGSAAADSPPSQPTPAESSSPGATMGAYLPTFEPRGPAVGRPASEEVATLVFTQASDFRKALSTHRKALAARGVDVSAWMTKLGTKRTAATVRASPELAKAIRTTRVVLARRHDGPRALAKDDAQLAKALPDEPVDTSDEVARLSLACRSLPEVIAAKAPELADAFRLDAMGE